MITQGFTYSYSDLVVVGDEFPYASTYLYVQTAADLVYEAPDGSFQWIQAAQPGYHPISALRIVASGSVNGTPRTTGVTTGLMYCCAPKY